IALGGLSLPLLRVRFMGVREELRYRDLGLQSLAIVIGAAILTFAALFVALHNENADRLTSDLDQLSSDIKLQLHRELGELDSALVDVTSRRTHHEEDSQVRKGRLTNLLGPTARADVDPGRYPFMEMLFWVDSTGLQTDKWSIRATTTPMIRIDKRQYFSEPMRGRLWASASLDSTIFCSGRYVEAIRSLPTVREAAVLTRL